MAQPYLSIIIPTREHKSTLALALIDVLHHLERMDFLYEILVIDDRSPDGTLEVAQRFIPLMKHLTVMRHEGPHGLGAVVKEGMKRTRGKFRFVLDPTATTSLDEFYKFLPYFERGYSMVASRLHCHDTWFKMLYITLVEVSPYNYCVTDEVAQKVFPKLLSSGFASGLEIVLRVKRLGYRLAVVSVFLATHSLLKLCRQFITRELLWDVIQLRFKFLMNVAN